MPLWSVDCALLLNCMVFYGRIHNMLAHGSWIGLTNMGPPKVRAPLGGSDACFRENFKK